MRTLLLLLLSAVGCFAQLRTTSPFFTAAVLRSVVSGTAPDAPTGLTISPPPAGLWGLIFTDTPSNVDGYEVQRADNGNGFILIGSASIGDGFYNDESVAPLDGDSYAYRIRATNAFGQSAWAGPVYTVFTFVGFSGGFYWRMDEAAGNNRVSRAGYADFSEEVGTVAQAVGKATNAASFSSASGHYFRTTDAIGTGLFDANFTISFWIYPTALPAVATRILRRDATDDLLLVLTSAGDLKWTTGGTLDLTPASRAIGSLNAWHFVVLGYDTSPTAWISVDGSTLADSLIEPSGSASGDDLLDLGSPIAGLLSVDARIDEFAIYGATLTQNDIAVLYNSSVGIYYP